MVNFSPTPHGDKLSGRWPDAKQIPYGAVLQCRHASPKPGVYFVLIEAGDPIPDHPRIVAWAAIPAPLEVDQA
jgi:hypothetical protein